MKLSGGGGCGMCGGPGSSNPTRINYSGFPLKNMMIKAFGVPSYQIIGPGWLDDTIYEIQANLPSGTTNEQLELMLQNLLRERLGMTFHREKKEFTTYDLVTAKDGPRLTPSKGAGMLRVSPRPDGFEFIGDGVPVKAIAIALERQSLHAPVIDKTGITGTFSFKIGFDTGGSTASPYASLPAALSDIGLKLEKSKTTLDTIVIDTINKVPAEN